MVLTSSRYALRWERIALASAAASSRRSFRSRCSLILSEASAMSMSDVSMAFQMRPSRRLTSSSSSSTVRSLLRCSLAMPSISSSTALHQLGDAPLGEDVEANLVDDHLLEAAGVEPGGNAGVLAALHDRLADVIGELAALGVLAAESALPHALHLTKPLSR